MIFLFFKLKNFMDKYKEYKFHEDRHFLIFTDCYSNPWKMKCVYIDIEISSHFKKFTT